MGRERQASHSNETFCIARKYKKPDESSAARERFISSKFSQIPKVDVHNSVILGKRALTLTFETKPQDYQVEELTEVLGGEPYALEAFVKDHLRFQWTKAFDPDKLI